MPTESKEEGHRQGNESSDKVNFAKIFPHSAPPFRVTSTLLPNQFFQQRPSASHPRIKSTVQLHKERIQKSEKLVGDAFSECAKNFIGSTDSKIWENSDAFGISGNEDDTLALTGVVTLSSTPKKTGSTQLKPILKTSPPLPGALVNQGQPPKTNTKKKSIQSPIGPLGDCGRVGSQKCQKSKRQVTFDIPTKDCPPELTRHNLLEHNALKLDKEPGVAKLRLKSPPPRPQNSRRGSTNEEVKVIHGYAFMISDADTNILNTFADTQAAGLRIDKGSVVREPFYEQVNMEGFLDSELSFQTDDTSLVVTGLRLNRDGLNARKVCEVIEFPKGVYHETLLISRDQSGLLTIQQYMI